MYLYLVNTCICMYRRQSGHDAQVRNLRAHSRHGVLAKNRVDHGQHYSVFDVPVFSDYRLCWSPKWSVKIYNFLYMNSIHIFFFSPVSI